MNTRREFLKASAGLIGTGLFGSALLLPDAKSAQIPSGTENGF